jgi:hypothetical protein
MMLKLNKEVVYCSKDFNQNKISNHNVKFTLSEPSTQN